MQLYTFTTLNLCDSFSCYGYKTHNIMLGLFCGKMLVEIETFTSQGCFTEVSSGTLNLLHFKSVFCFLFFFLLFLSYILVSYSIFV